MQSTLVLSTRILIGWNGVCILGIFLASWIIKDEQERILALDLRIQELHKTVEQLVNHERTVNGLLSTIQTANPYNCQPYISRVAMGERLHRLASNHRLKKLQFAFMPEQKRPLAHGQLAQITAITFNFVGSSDRNIFRFIKQLPELFPGFVIPKLLDMQQKEGDLDKAIQDITGSYHVDWVVLERKSHIP